MGRRIAARVAGAAACRRPRVLFSRGCIGAPAAIAGVPAARGAGCAACRGSGPSAGVLHPRSLLRRGARRGLVSRRSPPTPPGSTAADFLEELRRATSSRSLSMPATEWFRYHHLFQELLENELLSVRGPDQVAALHQRASKWFEREGLIDEALKHALAAEDMERAAGWSPGTDMKPQCRQVVRARELAFAAPDRGRGAARGAPDGSGLDSPELLLPRRSRSAASGRNRIAAGR